MNTWKTVNSESGRLTHELLNRLSVIVGNCDLVSEKIDSDPVSAKLLLAIRENAEMVAVPIRAHRLS